MNILLDTHILLWYLQGSEELQPKAVDVIEDSDNSIYVSITTLWEVQIKHMKHPDQFSIDSDTLANLCDDAGFMFLQIEPEHISKLPALTRKPNRPDHEDPFDRMILAQAESEDMKLMTSDKKIIDYVSDQILFFKKKKKMISDASNL